MTRVPVDSQGWDHRTELVDGAWIERTPLAPETVPRLHDSPPEFWEGTGIAPDADQAEAIEEMARDVVPLLPAEWQSAGRALVDRVRGASAFEVLRHSDLGPEHLLTTDGRVSGVIDWTDVALGDPALDLSWLVCRTPSGFADALVTAYGATDDELARGRDWNLIAPWWEVRYGLQGGGEEYVESGLEGALERLRGS